MKEEKMVATYAELNEKLKNSNSFKFGTPITDEAMSEAVGDKTCYCLFKDGRSEGHFTSVSDGCLMRAEFDHCDPFPTIFGRDSQFFEKRSGFWYRIPLYEYLELADEYNDEIARKTQTEAERIASAIVGYYESGLSTLFDSRIEIDRKTDVRSIDEKSVEIFLLHESRLMKITVQQMGNDNFWVEFSNADDEETLGGFAIEFWQNVTETELGISGKLTVGYWWDNCFHMFQDREKAGEHIRNLLNEQ